MFNTILGAVTGNIWRAVAIVALIFAGVQTVRVHFKDVQIEAEQTAHAKTKITYREAQVKAQELERKRIDSVVKQQETINENRAVKYNERITALDARVAQLLRRREETRGKTNLQSVSSIPDTSSGTYAETGEDGFPTLSLEDRVIATETAIRLEELQTWVKEQVAIDPNKLKKEE